MIEIEFINSLAFPCRMYSLEGDVVVDNKGLLFPSADHLLTDDHVNSSRNAAEGWSVCNKGFARYRTPLPPGDLFYVVFYGLKIKGLSVHRGKSESLSIFLKKHEFENYIHSCFQEMINAENFFKLVARVNIHEIRSINTQIYNRSEQILIKIEGSEIKNKQIKDLTLNIKNLAQLVRARTQFIDAISSDEIRMMPGGKIPLYKNFDRIRRSLYQVGLERGIRINLTGQSTGRVMATKLLDIAPYLVLENCLKYSPDNREINCSFIEDTDRIRIDITSLGPELSNEELRRVFFPGFRGEEATKYRSEGSGIGMYFLRKIVETDNKGSINFTQNGDQVKIGDTNFKMTHFCLTFPRID